jgi:two-component system, cell cycle response regulator
MSIHRDFNLLLVEDEPTQRKLVERQLRRAGYLVDTAVDGEEALAKILTGQFQLLLTDWEMPGMDGRTLCRRVREANLPTYLYILLLTSHSSTDDVVAGLEAGADDYLRKPAVEAELLARLNSGRRIVVLEQSLHEANGKIRHLSETDSLLDCFNRRYLNTQLVREVALARQQNKPLSVIMSDLDHFKRINDERGHLTGDEVLQRFVQRTKSLTRESDWIARYGGEEFIVVLPGSDSAEAAQQAEKLRTLCALTPMDTSVGSVAVTASFGVAQLKVDSTSQPDHILVQTLLSLADSALYSSKDTGRNRVTVAKS